jgi:hypothetical protein
MFTLGVDSGSIPVPGRLINVLNRQRFLNVLSTKYYRAHEKITCGRPSAGLRVLMRRSHVSDPRLDSGWAKCNGGWTWSIWLRQQHVLYISTIVHVLYIYMVWVRIVSGSLDLYNLLCHTIALIVPYFTAKCIWLCPVCWQQDSPILHRRM